MIINNKLITNFSSYFRIIGKIELIRNKEMEAFKYNPIVL